MQVEALGASQVGAYRAAGRHTVDANLWRKLVGESNDQSADGKLGGDVEYASATRIEP